MRRFRTDGAQRRPVYRTGHYGAALLAYAPVLFLLTARGAEELAALGAIAAVALSVLPDLDERVPLVPHRGPTHTVLFVALVAGVLAAVGWYAAGAVGFDPAVLALFGAGVGVLGVGSHLLADALTPMGVTPFWPLSGRNYTLNLTRADNPVANWLLLALGVLATALALAVGGRL